MSLVTPTEVKAQVKTGVSDAVLEEIIAREEADVIRLTGPHYVDAETSFETVVEGGLPSLYLPRPLSSIASITEDDVALTAGTHFRVWASQGRIERLPRGSTWGTVVEIEYVPVDDSAQRRAVIIELVRLALERTGMKAESVAGEYSYSAPDWEVARAELLRRLKFMEV